MRSPIARLAPLLPLLLLGGCLAGPGTALGGPIGVAPDTRASEILAVPDSTRGAGFVLVSNRRDMLDATRLQLNASSRAFERLLGERPTPADVRLTSDEGGVAVTLRIGRRTIAPFTLPLGGGGRAARGRDAMRIALTVSHVIANEWLGDFVAAAAPAGSAAATTWSRNERLPVWLRIGMLEGVAESPVHDLWLSQLGRNRDALPPVATLLADEGCIATCTSRLAAAPSDALPPESGEMMLSGARPDADRALEGTPRFVASSYALVLFFFRREGAPFMRTLITAPLEGRTVQDALSSATSFSSSVGDIDRQWRVWLATYAYAPARQP